MGSTERACFSPGPWSSAETSPDLAALQLSILLPVFNIGLQRQEQLSAPLTSLTGCRDRHLSTSDQPRSMPCCTGPPSR